MWISWIDDCFVIGPKESLKLAKEEMIKRFDCDVIGNMDKYVGCKLTRNREERSLKFTQPVMIQSFEDEFQITHKERIPASPGQVLLRCDDDYSMNEEDIKRYRSGVGNLLHMMRWS